MNQTSLFRLPAIVAVVAVGLLSAACGDGSSSSSSAPTDTTVEPVIDPGDGGEYAPVLDPSDFVGTIDNPYLPLVPGNRWIYEETNGDG
jgi:hypothetical protein